MQKLNSLRVAIVCAIATMEHLKKRKVLYNKYIGLMNKTILQCAQQFTAIDIYYEYYIKNIYILPFHTE